MNKPMFTRKPVLLVVILLILNPFFIRAQQKIFTIKADSASISNAEFILENKTKDTLGFLYNKGNGRTEFRRALIPIGTKKYLIGKDTLDVSSSGGGTWGTIGGTISAQSDLKNFMDSIRTAVQVTNNVVSANLLKERNDSTLLQSFINTLVAKLATSKSIKLVVLGSSTAVGTGATIFVNTWVEKLTTYLKSLNAANTVINLAISTHTTYNELPTGSTIPSGKPAVDTAHNITKALSLAPDIIIVNLSDNDAASNFSLTTETEANIQAIVTAANNANIPIYVTTSQPRNNTSAPQMSSIIGLRDWTKSTYGNRSFDFWTTIANTDGTISSSYSYGDGINLNDAGYAILYDRVQRNPSFVGSVIGLGGKTSSSGTATTPSTVGAIVRYDYIYSPSYSSVDSNGNRTVFDRDNNYGHGGTDTIQKLVAGTDGIYYVKGKSKGVIIYFGKSSTSNYWGQGSIGINLDGGAGSILLGLVNGNRGITTSPTVTIDTTKFYGIRRQSGVWQMVTSTDEANWTTIQTLSPTNVDGDLYASFDILGASTSILYHPYQVGMLSYPVVSVGTDQRLAASTTTATIAATASQYNGTISSYSWTLVSGPNTPTITSSSSASTSITGLIGGAYIFKCVVTGTGGVTVSANLNITVAGANTSIGRQRIDFGVNSMTTSGSNWTNISDISNWYSAIPLTDIPGSTGLTINLPVTNFSWRSNSSTSSTVYPGTATKDYMSVAAPFAMTIHGLNPTSKYDFTFYSSVSATDTSTRGTGYSIGSTTVGMDVTNNINNTVTIYDVIPDSSGNIIINVGNFGANSAGVYTLSVLDINVKI